LNCNKILIIKLDVARVRGKKRGERYLRGSLFAESRIIVGARIHGRRSKVSSFFLNMIEYANPIKPKQKINGFDLIERAK
jgi:hypothetical protein